jgi:nucleoredoxin
MKGRGWAGGGDPPAGRERALGPAGTVPTVCSSVEAVSCRLFSWQAAGLRRAQSSRSHFYISRSKDTTRDFREALECSCALGRFSAIQGAEQVPLALSMQPPYPIESMKRTTILIAALLGAFSLPAFASLEKLLPPNLEDASGNAVSRESLDGKIIGLYFSAEWCPPCRAFTPELVKFRNENKEQFEVVFISSDRNVAAQRSYMKDYKMDFAAVPFRSEWTEKLRAKYAIRGIPTLIVIDSKGNLLSAQGRGDLSQRGAKALSHWQAQVK